MKTDSDLAKQAWAELTQTTITYTAWKQKGFPPGHWANAKTLLGQIITPATVSRAFGSAAFGSGSFG